MHFQYLTINYDYFMISKIYNIKLLFILLFFQMFVTLAFSTAPVIVPKDSYNDCGPACLTVATAHFGVREDMMSFKSACMPYFEDGASFAQLSSAAKQRGFSTLGMKCLFEDLLHLEYFPNVVAILRIQGEKDGDIPRERDHYVLLLDTDIPKKQVLLYSPPKQLGWQNINIFNKRHMVEVLFLSQDSKTIMEVRNTLVRRFSLNMKNICQWLVITLCSIVCTYVVLQKIISRKNKKITLERK